MELFDSVKTNLVPDTGNAFEMIERITSMVGLLWAAGAGYVSHRRQSLA